MDRNVIDQKLESLRRCVKRIEQKRPAEAKMLSQDWDLQDILTLNLTRAVQISVDLAMHIAASGEVSPPETMAKPSMRCEK